MLKKVRQRPNKTFTQTFHFNPDPPPTKPPQKCQQSCRGYCQDCRNPIEHPITRSQTAQQILHKQALGLVGQEKLRQRNAGYRPHKDLSTLRKEGELRGELEEAGVYFFYREKVQGLCRNHGGRLIATDCKFNHTCHGTNGPMNEHCNYPNKHFDWLLKQKYDFKHDKPNAGKIFIFKQKPIKSKK